MLFHSAFYHFPKKIVGTKYTKCYYFHSAYVMKTVSSSHFQFPLKPCGRLKINLKIGESIWLKLNCGYCNYHKFFLLKIILERFENSQEFPLWPSGNESDQYPWLCSVGWGSGVRVPFVAYRLFLQCPFFPRTSFVQHLCQVKVLIYGKM